VNGRGGGRGTVVLYSGSCHLVGHTFHRLEIVNSKFMPEKSDVYNQFVFNYTMVENGPPLWSSGQSSWLQIQRPGFDYRHYQKKKVVCLERSPLSLVSTTEELLDRKVSAPV
jgi:hypothetical protein